MRTLCTARAVLIALLSTLQPEDQRALSREYVIALNRKARR